MASSSSNVVGVHYRVGKKIGEGSFGVIFEGTNLLNNQQVAIKFVRGPKRFPMRLFSSPTTPNTSRNPGRATLLSYEMSTGRTRSSLVAVSVSTQRAVPTVHA